MYKVPITARVSTIALNNQPYGVIGEIEIAEKNHMQLREMILALLGIVPVSINSFI